METEIETLKQSLAALKTEMAARFEQIEQQINHLEQRGRLAEVNKPPEPQPELVDRELFIGPPEPQVELDSNPESGVQEQKPEKEPTVSESSAETHKAADAEQSDGWLGEQPHDPWRSNSTPTRGNETEESFAPAVGGVLGSFAFARVFGPFSGLVSQFLQIYRNYQEQGKATTFLLTVAGILTMILGFGYLLQYSFNHLLADAGKVVVGYLSGCAFVAGGALLARHKPEFSDYASSLMGLGIVLNHLTAYFTGHRYELIGYPFSLFLIGVNTLLGFWVAKQFDTKVVAVVAFLGGALSPLMFGIGSIAVVQYWPYLWVLALCAVLLASLVQWGFLAQLVVVTVFASLEVTIVAQSLRFSSGVVDFLLIANLHGFFYLFAAYGFRVMVAHPQRLGTATGFLAALNLFSLLAMLVQLCGPTNLVGGLLLANSFPAMLVVNWARKALQHRTLASVASLYAGVLCGAGILLLADPALLSILWLLESIILLRIGLLFRLPVLRLESLVLAVLGFLYGGFQIAQWLGQAGLSSFSNETALGFGSEWGTLVVMAALLALAVNWLTRYYDELTRNEVIMQTVCDDLLSVLLALNLLVMTAIIWPALTWNVAIISLFSLIFRGGKRQLPFTELLGWCHLIPLCGVMFAGAQMLGSFYFVEQPWIAQLARVEFLLALFGLHTLYQTYFPQRPLAKLAYGLRVFLYLLIPLGVLPPVWRHLNSWFPVAGWVSVALALGIYCRVSLRLIRVELWLLIFYAIVSTAIAAFIQYIQPGSTQGLAALFVGACFFGFFIYRWQLLSSRRRLNDSLLPLAGFGFYFGAVAVFVLVFMVSGGLVASLAVILYLTAGLSWTPARALFRGHFRLAYSFVWIVLVCLLMLIYHGRNLTVADVIGHFIMSVLGLAALGSLLHRRYALRRLLTGRQRRYVAQLWSWHALIGVVYMRLYDELDLSFASPIISITLVVHALVMLFMSQLLSSVRVPLQRLERLATLLFVLVAAKLFFVDMADASALEKVIAFIVIGGILLASAFQLQKSKNRQQPL